MKTTQPIRDKSQVRQLIAYYKNKGETRNYILILMSVHTALRISDLLRLKWSDIFDFTANRARPSITVTEKKTGKSKIIALNANIIITLNTSSQDVNPNSPVFANPRTGNAISRVQAYRIIRAAAEAIQMRERVSCHSLRKTFGYHAWKSGVSPAVIMEIYNHSSFAVTRRYLGVSQDDKNEVYIGLDFVG